MRIKYLNTCVNGHWIIYMRSNQTLLNLVFIALFYTLDVPLLNLSNDTCN